MDRAALFINGSNFYTKRKVTRSAIHFKFIPHQLIRRHAKEICDL